MELRHFPDISKFSNIFYQWLVFSNYIHMYNFYRSYKALFFTYLCVLLGPFNIIMLIYVVPKSYVVRQLVRQLANIMFISDNRALFHLC